MSMVKIMSKIININKQYAETNNIKKVQMKMIPFIKMHGLGNNYIYLDGFSNPYNEDKLSELAIAISNVNTGIGSDGLIYIAPSHVAALKMRIFNKDGSEGRNCGNGLRCVAKYAYEHKLVKTTVMTIETLSGIVEASIVEEGVKNTLVSVNMGKPHLARHSIPMLGAQIDQVIDEPFEVLGQKLLLTAVSMGNPHAIFFVQTLEDDPHRALGPAIEKDSRFPEKVNVEFVVIESPTSLYCRVWERGSGVTQACGTGACAVAVASILKGCSPRGKDIVVHLEGGDLVINWSISGDLYMTGPATTIANGFFVQM
jgi:diaminopimelate epimerase